MHPTPNNLPTATPLPSRGRPAPDPAPADSVDRATRLETLLLATAVGDALGLPYENLTPRRARKLFGPPPLRHRLLLGYGTTSDDADHTFLAAESLLATNGDPDRFARALAWRLRFWLLALPAGTGLATARAILKLWLGFPPTRSGVRSAGNGPAMRAAILGAYACDDPDLLKSLVRASTRLTHTDPAAQHGALAIALSAAYAMQLDRAPVDPDTLRALFHQHLAATPLLPLLDQTLAAAADTPLPTFLQSIGIDPDRGVSGYINHTVPASLFCWLRYPTDCRTAVEQIILAGGDTDSTAAITAALTSLTACPNPIPPDWLNPLILWPRSRPQARALAQSLSTPGSPPPPFLPTLGQWLLTLPRNLLFLTIVLLHGLRRLLPPY